MLCTINGGDLYCDVYLYGGNYVVFLWLNLTLAGSVVPTADILTLLICTAKLTSLTRPDLAMPT